MSNYHPLDVRHPSNRRFSNPNYLLDPPAASTSAPSRAPAALTSRSEAASRSAQSASQAASPPASPPASQTPAQIWGRPRAQTTASQPTARPQARGSFLRSGMWLLIFAAIIIWQNDYWPQIERWARWTAMDLGLPWPF